MLRDRCPLSGANPHVEPAVLVVLLDLLDFAGVGWSIDRTVRVLKMRSEHAIVARGIPLSHSIISAVIIKHELSPPIEASRKSGTAAAPPRN